MDLKESRTAVNIMRAFSGESQARNRYDISAKKASEQKLHVIEAVFKFTAKQELAHAKVFSDILKGMGGEKVEITADYPTDADDDILKLLRSAQHNEEDENTSVYPDFSAQAKSEGYDDIANKLTMVAAVERTHSERFKMFADFLEQNKLFVSDVEEEWVCLNCGHRFRGMAAPESCPVCSHPKGFFIRAKLAPYTE